MAICTLLFFKEMSFQEIRKLWELFIRACPSRKGLVGYILPPPGYLQRDVLVHSTEPCSDCTAVAEGQGFLIRNTRLEKCIRASQDTNSLSLASCKEHSQQQRWGWDPATGTIVSLHAGRCLSAHRMRHNALVKLEPCGDWERQAWSCSRKGHLTLQSLGFHLGTKEGGHKVFVSREKDKFSRWKTLADETVCAAARTAAGRPSKPTQQALDTRVWIYESKRR